MQPDARTSHVLCAALVGLMGAARAAGAETLDEAMAAALVSSPVLAGGREQLGATGQDIAISQAGFFPRVTLQASVTRGSSAGEQLVSPASTGSSLDQQSAGYSVTLEQPLFDGLGAVNAVQQARELTDAAFEDLRANKQRVLLDAVKAYMAVLRDRAAAGLLKQSANMLAEDLEIAGKLERRGQGTSTDIDQTAAKLAAARAGLAQAEANLEGSEAAFAQSIGHAPAMVTQPSVPDAALPGSLSQAQAATVHSHPEIAAAFHRVNAARADVERVKADLLPKVSLDATFARTYSNPAQVTDAGDGQVSVEVTLPISLGGETIAKLRQANFVLRQRQDEAASKRRELSAQVASDWSGLAGLRKQVDLYHRAAVASERALRGLRIQRKSGEKTALDVLNAEADLVQAKLSENRSRTDLIVSAYELLAGTGRLAAEAGASETGN